MEYRMEHDTMGQVAVPADKLWGAQTQRSFENFPIGEEKMPADLITAFGVLKEACAAANHKLGKLDDTRYALIQSACQAIRAGELAEHFPLAVWQTGSGTQTNMNCNEVIARYGNNKAGEALLHPNDHVNMSQSSNDTFPTALHIAAVTALYERLFPAIEAMLVCLERLEQENAGIVKTGRTHLQDAVPITFGQEISGWRSMVEHGRDMIRASLDGLYELALGGTAVGTGLNAPAGFGEAAAEAAAHRPALPHGPQQVPRADRQGRPHLLPRGLEGPGGEPHEDRQRRALAGLRPPVRAGGDLHPGKRARLLHHARQSEPHPVRGADHGGRPGHGQRRRDGHRRLPGQL